MKPIDLSRMAPPPEPRTQPKWIDLANNVSQELILNFNPEEQRDFLNYLEEILLRDYNDRIDNLEGELKRIYELRNLFKGEYPQVKS